MIQATRALTGDPSLESTVLSCSGPVQFPVGLGRGSRTLRRRTHSMRRISTASAASGLPALPTNSSASTASCSWYSSSQVDLMLISRKRANSFDPDAPHPSTMLKAIDSAEDIIWVFSDPLSLRGNERAARRTPRASSCALRHTVSRRKSCIPTDSHNLESARTQSSTRTIESFPFHWSSTRGLALSTITDSLSTQHLDPLSVSSDFPQPDSDRVQ